MKGIFTAYLCRQTLVPSLTFYPVQLQILFGGFDLGENRVHFRKGQEPGREVRFLTKVCGETGLFLLDFLYDFWKSYKPKSHLRASILEKPWYPPET
jgi:hypothetical protein